MAASTTGLSIRVVGSARTRSAERSNHRRRISPEAGRALEILGHAIEYLTDEYVHEGASFSANDAQLKAVQILMAMNRQIYFECPQVPTFRERWRALFDAHTA
jgi:hypothetical protein